MIRFILLYDVDIILIIVAFRSLFVANSVNKHFVSYIMYIPRRESLLEIRQDIYMMQMDITDIIRTLYLKCFSINKIEKQRKCIKFVIFIETPCIENANLMLTLKKRFMFSLIKIHLCKNLRATPSFNGQIRKITFCWSTCMFKYM